MSQKSLEDVINAAGNPVQLLRNSQTGPYIYPVVPPSSPTGETSSAPGGTPASSSTSRTT